jgi:hypothetical protein
VEVDVVSLAAEFPNDNPALHCGASWVCLEVTGAAVAVREERPRLAAADPAPQAVEALPVTEAIEAAEVIEVAALELELEPVVALSPTLSPVPEARISCVVLAGTTLAIEGVDEAADEGDEIVVEDLPPLDETAIIEGAVEVAVAEAVVVVASTALPAPSDDPFTVLLGGLVDVALGAGSPHVASVLPPLLLDARLEQGLTAEVLQALADGKIASGAELTPAFVAQRNAWRAILRGTSDDFGACGGAMLDEWAADLVARLLGAPSRATALRRDVRARGIAAFGLVEAA